MGASPAVQARCYQGHCGRTEAPRLAYCAKAGCTTPRSLRRQLGCTRRKAVWRRGRRRRILRACRHRPVRTVAHACRRHRRTKRPRRHSSTRVEPICRPCWPRIFRRAVFDASQKRHPLRPGTTGLWSTVARAFRRGVPPIDRDDLGSHGQLAERFSQPSPAYGEQLAPSGVLRRDVRNHLQAQRFAHLWRADSDNR